MRNILAKDIYTEKGEIIFDINGDISINDNSNYDLAQCLFYTAPGEFKQFPQSGINLFQYLNAPVSSITQQYIKNNISTNLLEDGFDINDLIIEYSLANKDYAIKTNCVRTR